MTYVHLGDAQLSYIPGMDPVVDPSAAPGHLLGSGTGTIVGPHLNGELRWSFFEEDCAWDQGVFDVHPSTHETLGRSVCRTYPRGIIETEDGALIQFEGQGFALRQEGDPIWKVASTVRFVTDDVSHHWLTPDLVNYEGALDEQAGSAIWSFHGPEQMTPSGASREKALQQEGREALFM